MPTNPSYQFKEHPSRGPPGPKLTLSPNQGPSIPYFLAASLSFFLFLLPLCLDFFPIFFCISADLGH